MIEFKVYMTWGFAEDINIFVKFPPNYPERKDNTDYLGMDSKTARTLAEQLLKAANEAEQGTRAAQ